MPVTTEPATRTALGDSAPDDVAPSERVPGDRAPEDAPAIVATPSSVLGPARPAGVTAGGLAFVGAWVVGLAIVRLTGAATVVLLLVITAVGLLGGALSGWWRLRSVCAVSIVGPRRAELGEPIELRVSVDDGTISRAPLTVSLAPGPVPEGARTTLRGGIGSLETSVERPGTVRRLDGFVGSTGTGGLLWWRRSVSVHIEPVSVAPRAIGPVVAVEGSPTTTDGATTASRGPGHGEVDGVRPWRRGEGDRAIHWPSTLRSRQLIAHDRQPSVETRWTLSLDDDPGRLRYTMERGLHAGHEIALMTGDDDEPTRVRDLDDAAHWSTIAADRSHPADEPPVRMPFWQRQLSLSRHVDEPRPIRPLARWLTALSAIVALNTLLGGLGGTPGQRFLATGGILVGAAISVRFRDATAPRPIRIGVTVLTLLALARIAVQASGIGGLIEALRGPMPDLLMMLLVLHGVESADRRSARVHLAITAVITAYGAGLRIDERVGWWMLAWGVIAVAALATMTTDPSTLRRRGRDRNGSVRRTAGGVAWATFGGAVSLGIAGFVPVPDGPASLGLPAVANSEATVPPGALVGPDGEVAPPASGDPGTRGALGTTGGYPGFSETLDTSIRGGLGEEVVMRVRAPEPAFWRGQTFTEFDGRTWRVSGGDGPLVDGPEIRVEPTLGDLPTDDVPIEEFVQTFHVESDLPNIVFAAARASTVIFDGAINTRPDGALRADRTLADGTIYSVVSQRVQVTPELLRAQGDLGDRVAEVTDPRAVELLAPFLALPDSTTRRTIELASQLRVEGSTYDTVLAYEAWLGANTTYDLDAPIPAPEADAVDDHLFVSQRGFCEQIASSLVVMLRSQGVPARLAAGYVPGERDQVSGVWKVRASDAHAWVEVWFPGTGWQAFDPTAEVPLAGEADQRTVGADVADALIGAVASRPVEIGIALAALVLAGGAWRAVRELARRRRRGPWGLLHDRFVDLAEGPDVLTAGRAATLIEQRLGGHERATRCSPRDIADELDRVAFDPSYTADRDDLRRVRRDLNALGADVRRARRRRDRRPAAARGSAGTTSSS